MQNSGKNAIFWSLTDKIFRQGLSFIVSIFLARLLNPDDFGVLAMSTIFYGWVELFTDFGLGQSIIQRKHVTSTQISTIFWINIGMGMVLYLFFFVASPFIGQFFENSLISSVVRVTAIGFIISSFSMVQSSLLIKNLDYKKNFYVTSISNVAYGVIGISLAFSGFGVWSLVWGGLFSGVVTAVLLWIFSSWRPMFVMKLKETKEMFHTGFHFMSFGFINSVFDSLDVLLFSKMYSAETVGHYNRAVGLRNLPLSTLILPITRPLFPIFSKIQDDFKEIQRSYFYYLNLLEFISFAIAGLIFLSAHEIITILYTDKWLVAAGYLKYAIWIVPLEPNKVIITSLLKGLGRLKLLINLNFFERGIVIVALAVGYFQGIEWFFMSYVFLRLCTLMQRLYYVTNIVEIPFKKQVGSLFRSILILFIGVVPVLFIDIDNIYLSLFVKSIVFVIIYVLTAYLFKQPGYGHAINLLKVHVLPRLKSLLKR